LGPCDLSKVLAELGSAVDPRVLVGAETLDDAAALAVSDDLAILFTADFITPLVDDPRTWGRIAAANSLSDIYAMGGRPLAALNLVCWPSDLPTELLTEVLRGGRDTASEAACPIVGGHTVADKEPKYGLAVIGTVHPGRILRNRGARPDDRLYLSKPLGTGIITTAAKGDAASVAELTAAVESMCALNRAAAEAAAAAGVRALTDVTGFGLAGHLTEMLGGDDALGAELSLAALPVLPGALPYMAQGMLPGGAYRNRTAYADRVRLAGGSVAAAEMLLYDPQTSGGLLAAVPPAAAPTLESEAARRGARFVRIGTFTGRGRIDVGP
jgi:selenide,water dikinase